MLPGLSPPILLPTQGTRTVLPLGPCHLHSGHDKMSSGTAWKRSCLQVLLSPKTGPDMTIFIPDYQLSAFPYRLGLCLSLHRVQDKLLWMATKSKVQASQPILLGCRMTRLLQPFQLPTLILPKPISEKIQTGQSWYKKKTSRTGVCVVLWARFSLSGSLRLHDSNYVFPDFLHPLSAVEVV